MMAASAITSLVAIQILSTRDKIEGQWLDNQEVSALASQESGDIDGQYWMYRALFLA